MGTSTHIAPIQKSSHLQKSKHTQNTCPIQANAKPAPVHLPPKEQARKSSINTAIAKPFVKWAGGKSQLLNKVQKVLPQDLASRKNITYVEPFVGGGAVLFWILQTYPNIKRAIINDINQELISTYLAIQNDVENLIQELLKFQQEYISLAPTERSLYFLEKRQAFNKKDVAPTRLAALFIFLNRTCFNGLYRVNAKGYFNVPHGKYANPKIADESNLRACSRLLQKVEILCGDFEQTSRYASRNSIFYLDPPYKPLSTTSAFTSYTRQGFDDTEQIRLGTFCQKIARKGALFIESNSDPKNINPKDTFFDSLYETFSIQRVSANRMINSNAAKRGAISELLISNVENV